MTDPTLPAGPLPTEWRDIDHERARVLRYLEFVSTTFDPGNAKSEIERASARLIQLVYADYESIRREGEEIEGVTHRLRRSEPAAS